MDISSKYQEYVYMYVLHTYVIIHGAVLSHCIEYPKVPSLCTLLASQESGEGGRRLEWARLLKERNEYKEKYYSLLDQVKLNDELSLFKSKPKRSKWLD